MSDISNDLIEPVLQDALALIERATGTPFRRAPEIMVASEEAFWAMIRPKGDGYAIHINSGTIRHLRELWTELSNYPVLTTSDDKRLSGLDNGDAIERQTHTSLTWLMLHELMHVRLRHFEFIDAAEIVELSRTQKLPPQKVDLAKKVGASHPGQVRHCFEMQADGEATDILLSEHAAGDFEAIRIKLASIMAVQALIERGNQAAGTVGLNHPSASARFFTFMAGVFQRWMYEEGELEFDGEASRIKMARQPSEEELKTFFEQLVMPVVNDAVTIATAANVKSFIIDMGDQGAMFQDIFTAQYGEDLGESRFKTEGAKEWARLIVINEKLAQATGLRNAD